MIPKILTASLNYIALPLFNMSGGGTTKPISKARDLEKLLKGNRPDHKERVLEQTLEDRKVALGKKFPVEDLKKLIALKRKHDPDGAMNLCKEYMYGADKSQYLYFAKIYFELFIATSDDSPEDLQKLMPVLKAFINEVKHKLRQINGLNPEETKQYNEIVSILEKYKEGLMKHYSIVSLNKQKPPFPQNQPKKAK